MAQGKAQYPRVHLAMDNAFAAKRWTAPEEWTRIIRDLGVTCIEASADTEADPFYCGADYLDEWLDQVQAASRANGVRVVNFFTGYTTYRTIGLAHPDARIRNRIVNDWLKVMARIAGRIRAGLGFYIHAFPESLLQDPLKTAEARESLYNILAEVSRFAGEAGPIPIIVEQMYAPHQIPWTVEGTFEYLLEVSRRSGFPAYVTIDTGHQTGQRGFLRPSGDEILRGLAGNGPAPYLGPESAYGIFEDARRNGSGAGSNALARIEKEMDRCPHLFAEERDCDLYRWLEELGCYSSILHLQQTSGKSSSHLPFTAGNNTTGIVHPRKVLEAIARSCEKPARPGMPERCSDIYLTFEIFPRTSDHRRDLLSALGESVEYWRTWVPEDGMSLDALLRR